MKLLVTGTSGGIGGAVGKLARERGWEVFGYNRGDFAAGTALPDGLDGMVFATGMCPVKPLAQTGAEDFAETIRVNCGLFVELVRRIVKERRASAGGLRIVAVSSVSAVEGWAGGVAYCASKGALSAACRALDAELAPKGIRVKAIEPRYVKTRMFDACAGRMGVPASEACPPEVLADDILAALAWIGRRRDATSCRSSTPPTVRR